MNQGPETTARRLPLRHLAAVWLAVSAMLVWTGCAAREPKLQLEGQNRAFAPGAIIDAASGETGLFDGMIDRLAQARVVYVGERHTSADHHAFQLRVLKALVDRDPDIVVGMEMFDRTYQPVLDRWSRGELTETAFVRATHWYANWRFPYRLYRDLLDFVRERRLPLVGLNVPFHLPSKIAVGGLDSLRPQERELLPAEMDLTLADHRRYVRRVFDMHRIPGREDFEAFYAAQCAWEEGMAETVAGRLGAGRMVVLAGNGHIVKKFGIPQRAHRRLPADYLTVYQAPAGDTVAPDAGDFIRVSPPRKARRR